MAISKKETAAQLLRGADELHGAAGIGRNLHWQFVVVVVSEGVKSQADLFEVVQALYALAAELSFAERRQKERRQDRYDGDDQQHFQKREAGSAVWVFGEIHRCTMANVTRRVLLFHHEGGLRM